MKQILITICLIGLSLFMIAIITKMIPLLFNQVTTLNELNKSKTQCELHEIKEYGKCISKGDKLNSIYLECSINVKHLIDGTMSDTWGNDEYNTEEPSKVLDKHYGDCVKSMKEIYQL